jgi:serine/threonine-protein phosphatase 2B regulatory subunit
VSSNDIEKLYHHFLRIDTDASGTIERSELLALPGNAENPLASRILETFDTNGDGRVDFGEFVNGLAVFSGRGSRDSKIRCKRNKQQTALHPPRINLSLFISL